MADKRVELDGIWIDDAYIYLTIQWYEHITGISVSDTVYRLYSDDFTQVQRHTQLEYGNISMTRISGTAERHTSTINKIPSP